MNRLLLWSMSVVLVGSQCGLVLAADPAPEARALPPAANANNSMVWTEVGGGSRQVNDAPAYCPQDDRDRNGVIGGVGMYFMQPYFKDNPAFSVSTTSPTGPGGTDRTVTERTNISHHMEVAPLIWLGYVTDSGLGGRVRWWYFRQGTGETVAVPAGGGGTLTLLSSAAPLGFAAFSDNDGRAAALNVTSKLQLQVWDAEAIDTLQAGNWNLLVAGGVRFAHINQHYNAFVIGDSGGGTGPISATVLSGHSFNGAGPVLALEARRALGDTALSLYSSARGALLFGSAKQTASDLFIGGGATFIDTATDRRNSVLPVGELELGLEYGRDVRAAHAFGQIALVGQQWWGAGSASRGVNTNVFAVPIPAGSSVDTDLGFLGVSFRLGLNY